MNVVRFYRSIYRDNRQRVDQRRNLLRDLWLYGKNRAFEFEEKRLVAKHYREFYPLIFIVGAPRSGTTLLFQLMARFLDVGYVNNFVARYWMAPLCGTQRYRRIHSESDEKIPLTSQYGATTGIESPHEFSYFWQFWLDFDDTDHLTAGELLQRNWKSLRRELFALSNLVGLPFVFKSINYVDYHVLFFAQQFSNVRFIHIKRDPRFTAQSILQARRQRYGSERIWWSIRPRDVHLWQIRDPVNQVCHQILDVQNAISDSFRCLPEHQRLTIYYEDLVNCPLKALESISKFVPTQIKNKTEMKELQLKCQNKVRMDFASFKYLTQQFETNCASM